MPVLRRREYLEIQRDKQTVCKAVMEGISPGWNMSCQNSGKLGQCECNNIQLIIVLHYTF